VKGGIHLPKQPWAVVCLKRNLLSGYCPGELQIDSCGIFQCAKLSMPFPGSSGSQIKQPIAIHWTSIGTTLHYYLPDNTDLCDKTCPLFFQHVAASNMHAQRMKVWKFEPLYLAQKNTIIYAEVTCLYANNTTAVSWVKASNLWWLLVVLCVCRCCAGEQMQLNLLFSDVKHFLVRCEEFQ